jgi:hypothetical protein
MRIDKLLCAACEHKKATCVASFCLALLTIAVDLRLPAEIDLTVLLALPLMLVASCCGPKLGLATLWTVAVLAEAVNRMRWGNSVSWFVTPLNIAVWGTLASLFVVIVASAMQAQRLREEAVQMQTLRQLMVTVQDIVRNRLQLVTVVCDYLDGGVLPPALYRQRLRAGAIDMMALLDELARAEAVTVYELSDGVRGVAPNQRIDTQDPSA